MATTPLKRPTPAALYCGGWRPDRLQSVTSSESNETIRGSIVSIGFERRRCPPCGWRQHPGRLPKPGALRGAAADGIPLGADDPAIRELVARLAKSGVTPVAAYRDPLGGRPLLLAAVPVSSIEPTPYQRELSPTHAKRLAAKRVDVEDASRRQKVRHDEAAARHEKGLGFLPAGRKEIRTVWTWGFTPHMLYLPDWLEEEFGMSYLECGISTLPAEIVGYVSTASVESMIEGLAWRAFNFPMGRTSTGFSDVYVQDLVRVAKTYKADAAVFSGHTACKHSWAAVKMLGDVLQEDPGIPSFKWETDFLDRRFTPHSVAKKQLAEFFRTLL